MALENTNGSGQNNVIGFVNAAILRFHRNAVSRVLQLPNNLPPPPKFHENNHSFIHQICIYY